MDADIQHRYKSDPFVKFQFTIEPFICMLFNQCLLFKVNIHKEHIELSLLSYTTIHCATIRGPVMSLAVMFWAYYYNILMSDVGQILVIQYTSFNVKYYVYSK